MKDLQTKDQIINLLKIGDIQLRRDTRDGFIYILTADHIIQPINQQLAKQIIQDPHITQERWREGWNGAIDTGKVRWVHV